MLEYQTMENNDLQVQLHKRVKKNGLKTLQLTFARNFEQNAAVK